MSDYISRKAAALIAQKDQEIERLRLENNQLHTECGHLRANAVEMRAEIDRLRAALLTCSDLARGEHHSIPSDRCAAICIHVNTAIKAEGGGG